ncbi:hypothetical protein MPH_06264 [Macrophomina phaseolina MS6]|uniref:Uncharacterized protein n=1 Tax=Macrophomina phaseolina (strain MS6) TaxID=1126212 RepID=K2RP28_MACPH|nr:hypothetical protein MPH_06264 [Macrophomina phaseolina MS6]
MCLPAYCQWHSFGIFASPNARSSPWALCLVWDCCKQPSSESISRRTSHLTHFSATVPAQSASSAPSRSTESFSRPTTSPGLPASCSLSPSLRPVLASSARLCRRSKTACSACSTLSLTPSPSAAARRTVGGRTPSSGPTRGHSRITSVPASLHPTPVERLAEWSTRVRSHPKTPTSLKASESRSIEERELNTIQEGHYLNV